MTLDGFAGLVLSKPLVALDWLAMRLAGSVFVD